MWCQAGRQAIRHWTTCYLSMCVDWLFKDLFWELVLKRSARSAHALKPQLVSGRQSGSCIPRSACEGAKCCDQQYGQQYAAAAVLTYHKTGLHCAALVGPGFHMWPMHFAYAPSPCTPHVRVPHAGYPTMWCPCMCWATAFTWGMHRRACIS